MVSPLLFLLTAAVVLLVLAVHLLAALARCLLPTTLFVLGGLAVSLAGIVAVSICHKRFLQSRGQYNANHGFILALSFVLLPH